MKSLLYRYIFKNFVESFISVFLTLFLLTSVITIISIANITSVLRIDYYDFLLLYLFMIPRIILYTLPITFFISLALSLANMSRDNETIVLFSLGMKPKKLAQLFFVMSLVATFFTLINVLVFAPITAQFKQSFMIQKKMESELNIRSSEFGQQFGSWYVFVGENIANKELKNIVLYDKSDSEKFIIANEANITNQDGVINLDMHHGNAFILDKKDTLTQINFETMKMNNYSEIHDFYHRNFMTYWKEVLKDKGEARRLTMNVSIALFPLVSFLMAYALGVFNRRYDKSMFNLYMFVFVVGYFVFVYMLSREILFWTWLVVPVIFVSISRVVYTRKIVKHF